MVEKLHLHGNSLYKLEQYRLWHVFVIATCSSWSCSCRSCTATGDMKSSTHLFAFRGAELLYRTGLGLMGLDTANARGGYGAVKANSLPELWIPKVDSLQAITLLLNLAQTLLSMPQSQKQRELAAIEAALVRTPRIFFVLLLYTSGFSVSSIGGR